MKTNISLTPLQEEVYRATTKGLIEGLISGYNATVFAYGPTGLYPRIFDSSSVDVRCVSPTSHTRHCSDQPQSESAHSVTQQA